MKAIIKLFMVLFFVSGACSSGTSLAVRDESTDYAAGNESPGFLSSIYNIRVVAGLLIFLY